MAGLEARIARRRPGCVKLALCIVLKSDGHSPTRHKGREGRAGEGEQGGRLPQVQSLRGEQEAVAEMGCESGEFANQIGSRIDSGEGGRKGAGESEGGGTGRRWW